MGTLQRHYSSRVLSFYAHYAKYKEQNIFSTLLSQIPKCQKSAKLRLQNPQQFELKFSSILASKQSTHRPIECQ